MEGVGQLEHEDRDADAEWVVRVAVRAEHRGTQPDAADGGQLQREDDDGPVLELVDALVDLVVVGCVRLGLR